MSEHTSIEWCHHTFNIAWGCDEVSPGCAHCYAKTLAKRYGHDVWRNSPRRTFGEKHWREPVKWDRDAASDGVRRRVFCSSMCDVFEDHPTIDEEREKLWPLIRSTPNLDWLLLTKRAERIRGNLPADWGDGYPNVWMGTSVENQRWASRIPLLLQVPAVVHFLSCEPLLGPVNISIYVESGFSESLPYNIDWVIAGGESGPKARPMDLEWARWLRDQCYDAGVPFLLKQLGGKQNKRGHDEAVLDGRRHLEFPTPRVAA